ncbi:uncharacterized protein [Oscarella lobularis]|uniref:uncharacterized protein isoform X2 n=1 Tax=Oscarella lobularis TaxID=121494 RepID=UPI0033136729
MRGALGPLGTQTPTRLSECENMLVKALSWTDKLRKFTRIMLPISLVLPLQLLFIITCAAVTQGKVAIQSSPTLSGYPITVSCIKGQANGENSPPSVTWIMNGLAIDFWATKYDRFSSSVVSAGSTTLYHLTIDPSDRGDNNATVSCQLQGYPPSEETRLVIYDSIPTVVANGAGNVTVEEDTLFRHSFRINFNFQGTIAVAYYQNTQIVGKEEILYIDGSVNVSLPAFPVVPTNSGILYVRIVVGGLPFIVRVFNLTVVNQKSLPKSSTSPPTSYDTTVPSTVTATPTEMATTIAGTQISANSTSHISSTHTTKPLTSDGTVPSPKALPWTASSENGTELSSVVFNAAPGTNSFLIVTVVMATITVLLLVGVFLVWRRIREALRSKKRSGLRQRQPASDSTGAGSLDQSISIDDGDAYVVAGQGAELQLRRAGQTDSSDSPLRDRLELATHREMMTPGMSSSPARSLDQSISKDDGGAKSLPLSEQLVRTGQTDGTNSLTWNRMEGMLKSATHEIKGDGEMRAEELKDEINSLRDLLTKKKKQPKTGRIWQRIRGK